MELTIKRGDIYYADLSPVTGCEQGGIRPVLMIQNNVGNIHSPTVIVAAITSRKKKRIPTHIFFGGRGNGLHIPSLIMLEQIRTIDRKRVGDYICTLDERTMKMVDRALGISLGLIQWEESKQKKKDKKEYYFHPVSRRKYSAF